MWNNARIAFWDFPKLLPMELNLEMHFWFSADILNANCKTRGDVFNRKICWTYDSNFKGFYFMYLKEDSAVTKHDGKAEQHVLISTLSRGRGQPFWSRGPFPGRLSGTASLKAVDLLALNEDMTAWTYLILLTWTLRSSVTGQCLNLHDFYLLEGVKSFF